MRKKPETDINSAKLLYLLNQCDPGFSDDFIKRYFSKNWYQYVNGNTICEINTLDGTLIMTSPDDFDLEFPVNIDLNISNKCSIGCPFCYQNSTKDGPEADLRAFLRNKKSFLWTLHPGTELAINGNDPLHPDLERFLKWTQKRGIFANLTVNEATLLGNQETLEKWLKKGLIHGLGISPSKYSEEMLQFAESHPTAVVHTIVGITTTRQYLTLLSRHIKVLILGYKSIGRGIKFKKKDENDLLNKRKERLKKLLSEIKDNIEFLSFDNLAISQLNPKKLLDISSEEYRTLFRGEDGSHTMFIDLVKGVYAKNSVQFSRHQYPITGDIKTMFAALKQQK